MERTRAYRPAFTGKTQTQPFFRGIGNQAVIQRTPAETCPRKPASETADSQRPEGILSENIVNTSTVQRNL